MRVSNLKKENLLSSLEVLIVDCQATGSNPAKGRLLEIGWARVRASSRENNEKITSYLIKLPHDEIIPTAVKRITGISAEDAARGLPPKKAWKKLFRAVKRTAAANKRGLCPTVIHFARFEEPYLREMHQKWSPGKPFPFEIICTHRVIKRLLPQLPRKGLRAAAGYLGYSVPELRRSASHIEATNFTWKETVKLLEQRGVRTLPELREWLEAPPAVSGAGSAGRVYPMAAKERSGLPGLPGVYRMLRSNGDLLYIGKATSLKQRVGSYFRKSAKHSERTLEMLTQANKLDITVTGSALEAALLESDEIKKHSPPYNAALRKGERRLFYFSSDLRQSAPGVDKVYRLGPVVSVQTLQSLAGIIELLEKGTGQFQAKLNKSFVQTFSKVWPPARPPEAKNNFCAELLGIPEEYAPGLEVFLQGVELFYREHDEFLGTGQFDEAKQGQTSMIPPGNIVNRVLLLGKELSRRKLKELAAAGLEEEGKNSTEIDENGSSAEDEKEEKVWTPEAAASMLEGIIRHGAHLLRRSRWFSLLSESTLFWQESVGKEKKRILLCFEGGQISSREDFAGNINEAVELPPPPGYRKSAFDRRRSFDLSTYDRMRVVTTELRRIVSEDKEGVVQVRLGPKAQLGKKELTELLLWV